MKPTGGFADLWSARAGATARFTGFTWPSGLCNLRFKIDNGRRPNWRDRPCPRPAPLPLQHLILRLFDSWSARLSHNPPQASVVCFDARGMEPERIARVQPAGGSSSPGPAKGPRTEEPGTKDGIGKSQGIKHPVLNPHRRGPRRGARCRGFLTSWVKHGLRRQSNPDPDSRAGCHTIRMKNEALSTQMQPQSMTGSSVLRMAYQLSQLSRTSSKLAVRITGQHGCSTADGFFACLAP